MRNWLTIAPLFFTTLMMAQTTYKYDLKKAALANGDTIAYVEEGAHNSDVIVMIHGLGGSIKHWYPIIDGLKNDFRCIAVDLPGYGESSITQIPETGLLSRFATDIDELANQLGLIEVTVVGHSMGGQVAAILALSSPDWMKNLVLAAPAGFEVFTESEGASLLPVTSTEAYMAMTEEQIRYAYRINFVNQPEWVEEMIQDRLAVIGSSEFKAFCRIRSEGVKGMLNEPIRTRLKEISYPTLVVYGNADQLIPNKYIHPDLTTEAVANVGNDIPGAVIKLLPDAGHMLQVEQPNLFIETLKDFHVN